MAATEMVASTSNTNANKFKDFAIGTLPAPVIGALMPGGLSFKAVVAAAVAVVQVAYYLTTAEYVKKPPPLIERTVLYFLFF
jgi:hypothetical protein